MVLRAKGGAAEGAHQVGPGGVGPDGGGPDKLGAVPHAAGGVAPKVFAAVLPEAFELRGHMQEVARIAAAGAVWVHAGVPGVATGPHNLRAQAAGGG